MKIRKVVIPIAGKGTRFLPIAKTICKSMLPILDRPLIQYLIKEALDANLTEIIFIVGPEQELVKDYLDTNSKYYHNLNKEYQSLIELKSLLEKVKITYITQTEQKGLGHAVLMAKDAIGDEPFACCCGDDLIIPNGYDYGIGSLVTQYNKLPGTYIGVKEVSSEDTKKYGVISFNEITTPIIITGIIEKPQSNPPSNIASLGRFILEPDIFEILENATFGVGGEIQLTEAIDKLAQRKNTYAHFFLGDRYDIGSKKGFVMANIAYSLRDQEIAQDINDYIDKVKNNGIDN